MISLIAIWLISLFDLLAWLAMMALSDRPRHFHFWPTGLGVLIIGACLVVALYLRSKKRVGDGVALTVLALPVTFGTLEMLGDAFGITP